jgi:hypothetical protein
VANDATDDALAIRKFFMGLGVLEAKVRGTFHFESKNQTGEIERDFKLEPGRCQSLRSTDSVQASVQVFEASDPKAMENRSRSRRFAPKKKGDQFSVALLLD